MNPKFNDQGTRDPYGLVLDIINDPDKYSAEQLQELLSDPETREIYELLSLTRTATKSPSEIDVNAEWKAFREEHSPAWWRYLMPGRRAASIIAIAMSSLVALAVCIVVSVNLHDRKPQNVSDAANPALSETVEINDITDAIEADSVPAITEPMIFEDEPLESIMNAVAAVYDVEVVFSNDAAAGLHLYYKLDPAQPLDKVIEQLNTFERINISQKGSTLTVD